MYHPSTFIASQLTERLREHAREAETLRQLHPEQLEIIYTQHWFNLFVPSEYGGLNLSLIDGLHLQESLSWADGSTGWNVTLCSGANYFIGFLPPDFSKALFSDPHVCFAGSGHPSGIAKKTADGYEVSGRWKYATGAPHATIFTAVCIIRENNQDLFNDDGTFHTRAFWFHRNEVVIYDDWNAMGMIATASQSFEVNTKVPLTRTFVIDKAHATLPNPIYQYPFMQFAEATLAVNLSGMAIRFSELCKMTLESVKDEKYNSSVLEKFEFVTKEFEKVRSAFYHVMERSWESLKMNKSINEQLLTEVSQASRQLAASSRETVNTLFPLCGMSAINPSSEINRVWRNIHTAGQHVLLSEQI
jgi:indole-3-acetate monooxygenase